MSVATFWKPRLLLAVGVVAVLWHILACVESPMSFSPEGDLAFVVSDPYGPYSDGWMLAGARTYRLMVLEKDGELREIERTSTHQLGAPAYSPDGQQIAYLRVPLLTPADWDRVKSLLEEKKAIRESVSEAADADAWFRFGPDDSAEGAPAAPTRDGSLGLPLVESLFPEGMDYLKGGGLLPAELIVRSVSGEPLRSFPIQVFFPLVDGDKGVKSSDFAMHYWYNYVLNRPQYDPGGEWIYCWVNFQSFAVNTVTGKIHRFDGLSWGSTLSPDGKTVAAHTEEAVVLVQTDGSRVVQARLARETSINGLAWVDAGTLAVLGSSEIDFYNRDGVLLRTETLSLPDKNDELRTLALSPDGRYMAISSGEPAFLTTDGEVLEVLETEEDYFFSQPVFTPDSEQVAFKLMRGKSEKPEYTQAIVFFSANGEELSRVPIPRVEQPAEPQPQQEKP
jgi:hypothetical protein